jgi:hypothetical protein
LFRAKSDFFVTALKGPFREKDGAIEFPEEEPAAFGIFASWIYESVRNIQPLPPISSDDALRTYLALCIMAYRLLIKGLWIEAFNSIYKYYALPNSNIINKSVEPKVDHVHYVFDESFGYGLKAFLCFVTLLHMRNKRATAEDYAKWNKFTVTAEVGVQLARTACFYVVDGRLKMLEEKELPTVAWFSILSIELRTNEPFMERMRMTRRKDERLYPRVHKAL